MLPFVLALGFLVAFLRGGRISSEFSFRLPWLILAGLALQVVSMFAPLHLRAYLVMASYLALLIAMMYNLDRQCLRIILVGLILNVIVIGLNGGKMPVSLPLAERLRFDTTELVNGLDFKRVVMSSETQFNFLGDIILVPFPVERVVSIGDLLIALGTFLMIQDLMSRPLLLRTTKLSL